MSSYETLGRSMTIMVSGLVLAQLGNINFIGIENTKLIGYGLSVLGGISTAIEFKRLRDPFRRIFENLKFDKFGEIPKLKEKRKTDYGYCLAFSLPAGMSTDDFEKHKLAIEQNLNKRIEISYSNYRVYIRVFENDLEKAPPFRIIKTKGKLEFPIGISYGGKVITVDLGKEPHLLIAGQTGGGKSTLLRGIITFIILTKPHIELYLIDLKGGVEFSVFRKSKNVKFYSKNKAEAEEILYKLLTEVEERLELFYKHDVVDINEFNRLKGVKKLKYKFVFIDEFSVLKKEKNSISSVEELAARARATGIHLIISTQRPDAEVINGRIKANIPMVIGFKTLNKLNSNIIIDQEGLEQLRGKGHGLLKYDDIIEFQSLYITNEQARDLVRHTYIEKDEDIQDTKEPDQIEDFSFLEKLGV